MAKRHENPFIAIPKAAIRYGSVVTGAQYDEESHMRSVLEHRSERMSTEDVVDLLLKKVKRNITLLVRQNNDHDLVSETHHLLLALEAFNIQDGTTTAQRTAIAYQLSCFQRR